VEEEKMSALSQRDWDTLVSEHLAYDDELQASDETGVSGAFAPARPAAALAIHSGALAMIDTTFAKAKEQLSGLFLIEARDMSDAFQVAARLPAARLGRIELVPIGELA
jgi:hypothetical protein